MKILYRKKDGKITMITDGSITFDSNIYKSKSVELTQDQKDNAKYLYYKSGVKIIKPVNDKKEVFNKIIDKLKTELTLKETRDEIIKLINNL